MNNASVRLLVIAGALTLALAASCGPQRACRHDGRRLRAASRLSSTQIDRYRADDLALAEADGQAAHADALHRAPTPDDAYRRWVRNLWLRRAAQAERLACTRRTARGWLCIHRYEQHPAQGWATRTGNGYYGGLQMDISFQRTYGPELLRTKGTADRWTPFEQMWVAERAYRSGRGFYPWPNTARNCGLI